MLHAFLVGVFWSITTLQVNKAANINVFKVPVIKNWR